MKDETVVNFRILLSEEKKEKINEPHLQLWISALHNNKYYIIE